MDEHEGAARLLGWALDGPPNFPALAAPAPLKGT